MQFTPFTDARSFLSSYELYRWAEEKFADRDYLGAAAYLEELLGRDADGDTHGLGAARLLLARSYYHSVRLEKALAATRDLLADEPDNGYAALLQGRTLQRLSRPDEAAAALRLAEALGQAS